MLARESVIAENPLRQSAESIPAGTAIAEFDGYAENYSAGMEHPLKRMLGATAQAFIEPKARWLLHQLRGPLNQSDMEKSCSLLDAGCGTGIFLQALYAAGFAGTSRGCDISTGMLAEAERRKLPVNHAGFDQLAADHWPYDDASFDVVTVCAVMHHVALSERDQLLSEARRVLRPGGYLFIFEHNPFNPITQLVVSQTPIDQNAILLTAKEVRLRLVRSNFEYVSTRYTMFAPPRFRWIERCERMIDWIPFGGQYAVTSRKPM